MGAPKQRWTAVEEAAFKAGITEMLWLLAQWPRMIQKLRLLQCTMQHQRTLGSRTQISRLDDLILEAITKLKEPRGSSRNAIAQYMEDRQLAPPDFERKLAANLKILTESGRLVKVKHQYRIAPSSMLTDVGKDPLVLRQEETPRLSSEVEKSGIRILTRAEVDAELEAMMRMTPQEAKAAAARAAAEAEAAIAAAEEAAKEAEEAEAEAEAARCFAEAAMKSLKYRTVRAW
ncbi:Telomere repeat-binding factor 2 [Abeliophyllum distichum]|uniref:Telomere repeat-binding factor 2 n=1 Tax=Abeliophyllum distichum TaxID=126358 RepID=A0ABD1V371_9LAMI